MAEPGRPAKPPRMKDASPAKEQPPPAPSPPALAPPYPIISQRPLDVASRRKLLGMKVGGKSRNGEEIPRTDTHELLVYKVNGKYQLDNGFGLSHEDVVNATHVAVVDMSRDRQVVLELPIPSRDSDNFQVVVTFSCTVTDPLVIIREGISAHSTLLSYLKSHHKIVQLGLGYPLSEVNEVRIDVDAEVRALATIAPPALPGMLVSLASIEVVTPEELAGFHRTVRGLKNTHTLDSLKQGYSQDLDQGTRAYANEVAAAQQDHDHLLAAQGQKTTQVLGQERVRFEHAMAIEQQEHDRVLTAQGQQNEQYLDQGRTRYENDKVLTQQQQAQLLAVRKHKHDLTLREKTNDFALQQLEKAKAAIGTDPQLALQFAFQAGAMTERELVAGLQAHQDRLHDDAQRALDREHAVRVFELQWEKETKRLADSEASEEQRFIRGIRAELVRDLIKKGYLDTIDPEALATDLLGELTSGTSAVKPALPSGDIPADRQPAGQQPAGQQLADEETVDHQAAGQQPAERQDDGPSVREEDAE